MAKSTRNIGGVEITSDKIVKSLVDRLFQMEERLRGVTKELNEHMEMIAEQQPKVMPDGRVRLAAMSADTESSDTFTVQFAAEVTKNG